VAGRIEDYAIVGDMQSVALVGAAELDASVLLIPDVGFLPADDPRVVSTMKVLQLANALELSGRHEEAIELFERLLALRNDAGLLSEGHAEECRRGPWDERRSVPG
jgi:GH15 family glucan-1,4-alpha-glucosidase